MRVSGILPGRGPEFQAFADQARPFDQLWRLPVGMVVIVVLWLLPVAGIGVLLFIGPLGGQLAAFASTDATSTLSNVAIFILVYPGLALTMRVLHKRGIGSLIGPARRFIWRHALISAAVTFLVGGASTALTILGGQALPNLPFPDWIRLAPFGLILLALQVSAEELLFRGYMMQQLGSRFQSRLIWWILPAILFGCLHFDPGSYGANAPLLVVAAGMLGLISGDLVARTGNLSASIGLHFANNVLALLVLGMPGPLSGMALFVADVDLTDVATVRAGLIAQIGLLCVIYLIWLVIIAFRRKRQLQSGGADLN